MPDNSVLRFLLFMVMSHILASAPVNVKTNTVPPLNTASASSSSSSSSSSFPSLPSNSSYLSALSSYLQTQSKRHAYGHLYIRGSTQSIEFFRSTFGGLIPCGSRDIVMAPDMYGCQYAEEIEEILMNVTEIVSVRRSELVLVQEFLPNGTDVPVTLPANGTETVMESNDTDTTVILQDQDIGVILEEYDPFMRMEPSDSVYRVPPRDTEDEDEMVNQTVTVLRTSQRRRPITDPLVYGRYVFARRGNCSFIDKALAAQRAGAAGLIIINNEPGALRMSMANNTDGYEIVIPLLMVPKNATDPLIQQAMNYRNKVSLNDNNRTNDLSDDILFHGVLKPSRDECVDPQQEDEERRKLADPAFIPYTAALASRLSPLIWKASTGKSGSSGTGTSNSSIINSTILTTLTLNHSTRLPGAWPPTTTTTCRVHLSNTTHESTSEGYLAHFSGPIIFNHSLEVVLANPFDACTELMHPEEYTKKVVLVLRGTCSMIDKARRVEQAGGAMIVIINSGNGNIGIAQAIGDGTELENPLMLPVIMISSQTGQYFTKINSTDHAVLPNYPKHSWFMRVEPSIAPASLWHEIEEVRNQGNKSWPDDSFHRHRTMLRFLRNHHPSSTTGDKERMDYLLALADTAGVGNDLRQLESALVWENGIDLGHASDDFGQADIEDILSYNSPGHAYLIEHMDIFNLQRNSDGILRCRMESGNSFTVRYLDNEKPSILGLTRRITDLLNQQACLEKLMIMNGAMLGNNLALLREESSAREWKDMSRTLLRTYRIPDTDVTHMLSSYIELYNAVKDIEHLGTGFGNHAVRSPVPGKPKPTSVDLLSTPIVNHFDALFERKQDTLLQRRISLCNATHDVPACVEAAKKDAASKRKKMEKEGTEKQEKTVLGHNT